MTEKRAKKTDAELQKKLTDQQFCVTQQKGTEPAFNNKYWNSRAKGTYHCVCCGKALFSSEVKYDSGTGWPSFWQPASTDAVATHPDHSIERLRTEVICGNCGAHLGHVFEDGPQPTGRRYCINSASLELNEQETEK